MDRQKKLLIIGAAWVSALLVTWALYANVVAPKNDKQVQIAVAARDLPIGTLLQKADVKMVAYPERVAPRNAVLKASDAEGRVVLFPVSSGEVVIGSKLSARTSTEGVSSTIDPGLRAVSVQITDVTGVAGLILPNSHVDVLFTRPGSLEEASTSTILQNIKVLSVGKLSPTGQAIDPRAPKSPVVTLVLSPEDAQKLELAKNQGKISLTLRNPLDAAVTDRTGPVTTDALDPELGDRISKARKARAPAPAPKPSSEDQKVWERLAREAEAKRKEADKPKAVVDVFRGDKHVQEVFK